MLGAFGESSGSCSMRRIIKINSTYKNRVRERIFLKQKIFLL
jgi:hypothetical protein